MDDDIQEQIKTLTGMIEKLTTLFEQLSHRVADLSDRQDAVARMLNVELTVVLSE